MLARLNPDGRNIARLLYILCAAALAGCGSPDLFSSGTRSSSGLDGGLSGNYGGYGGGYGAGGGFNGRAGGNQTAGLHGRGVYPRIETSFELPDVKGNPFDYAENDVIVTITTPDNRSVKAPAFFDGGKTWRLRYTPDTLGHHGFSNVALNGKAVQAEKIEKREFDVSGQAQPGFIRRDQRDKTRFAFDNGNGYFPLGQNQARVKTDTLLARIEKMGKAGENWCRIPMSYAEETSLELGSGQKAVSGAISLEAVKRWDEILSAAEKHGVYLQIVLQESSPLTSRTTGQWESNPWNKKNGGPLSTPDEFFSNARAVSAAKARYRYILARWGSSPNVMAWELFDEVENTDAVAHKHLDEVDAWHNGMAAFIRQHDPYKHLITTSSDVQLASLWQNMDFYQPHRVTRDPLTAGALNTRKLDRPAFYGEFTARSIKEPDEVGFVRRAIWAGITSGAAGSPGISNSDAIDKNDLYGEFRSASEFVRTSGLLSRHGLLPAAATIETKVRDALTFEPAGGWGGSKVMEFIVSPSGSLEGLAALPAYLQGSAHKELFTAASFKVNYAEAGIFKAVIRQVAREGAHVVLSVDGSQAAEKQFPATGKETEVDAVLEAKVPAGAHVVKLENTGLDWALVDHYTLAPYAPAMQALGRSSKDYAALLISNRGSKDTAGTLTLNGLQGGTYKASWFDPEKGKPLSEETVSAASNGTLSLNTPAFNRDVALYISRSGEKTASKPPVNKKGKGEPANAKTGT